MANDHSDDRTITDEYRPDVSALASTVISVLNDKGDEGTRTIRNSVVLKLVDGVLRPGPFDPEALLDDLRDSRISADQIVDIYIPQTAHELGAMWVDDIIGFAKVTIATARLQGLLTLLAPPWSAKPSESANDTNVLLILQGDDSHTLGPHVATAQMRRMGASVRILFGASSAKIVQALSDEGYDMALFSGSRPDALAKIAKLVKRIRAGILAPPPLVLGGIVLNLADGVKEKTDVDLVTNDVKVALKLCENKKTRNRSLAR
ncbi:cobalamin B12-binding domain-containing protein [Marivita sp. S6314]|uniref:cobalamin B12-binding domain-containing protein n=1 Tax=Marivita sp. S6314 TaxID=2926406 RepID=UPI001FF6E15A|nr:cobalamin B12-binding domain-containing protein [Marivita sp. S6314]MCK0151310.1 cobalamin B12-binding domain-containing protein [Marivita sp. S6314]